MEPTVPRSGRITKIEDQVRDPDRVSVFIEDEFAMGLSRRILASHRVEIGQFLSAEEISALMLVEESDHAWTAAVRLLSHRPRSRSEIETRLRRRQFSAAAIDRACSLLEEQGYLDDRDFARFWVENRVEHRPRGRRLLKQELRAKGVDDALVDQAIDESDLDESAAALEQARRRWEQLGGLESHVRKRRLVAFLQRRGYNWDVIRAVTAQLESSEPVE